MSKCPADDIYLGLNLPDPGAPLAHSHDRPVSWSQMMADIEYGLSLLSPYDEAQVETEKMPEFEPFVLD